MVDRIRAFSVIVVVAEYEVLERTICILISFIGIQDNHYDTLVAKGFVEASPFTQVKIMDIRVGHFSNLFSLYRKFIIFVPAK